MSIKKILTEGILSINIEDVNVSDKIIKTAIKYDKEVDKLVESFYNDGEAKAYYNKYFQFYEYWVKFLKENKFDDISQQEINKIKEQLTFLHNRFPQKLYKYFDNFFNSLDMDFEANLSISQDGIISPISRAYFANQGTFSYIGMDISTMAFLHQVYTNKELVKSTFKYVIEHELAHANQSKIFNTVNKNMNKYNPKNIKTTEKYVGTALELPAQALSLAKLFYRDANMNVDKALENLKKRKLNNEPIEHALKELYDYIRKHKSSNKKVNQLIKYAYLYLMNEK